RAQFFQDVFVRWALGDQRNGYFVEFGATDGVYLSNSHFLETERAWFGILAEPAHRWHESLKRNRQSIVDTRCIWSTSGATLPFFEPPAAELSTIASLTDDGPHAASRAHGEMYDVVSVSLDDLLHEHHAPAVVDYLSVDTEGSELAIL